MKFLAIDTATEACSAALYLDGEIIEDYRMAPRQHASLILPMIEKLLADTGLTLRQCDALCFGRGPGAFTGIRIATGVIQGLALGSDRPVIGISTMAAMAQHQADSLGVEQIYVAIDARMDEVYCASYARDSEGLVHEVLPERVCSPEQAPTPDSSDWHGCGSGFESYGETLGRRLGTAVQSVDPQVYPHAASICRLSVPVFEQDAGLPAEQVVPVYLRDKVTHGS